MAVRGKGRERRLVQLGARDHRNLLVEETYERTQEARLRLSTQAEEDNVVPRQNRVLERGQDRLLVAEDAGEDVLAALQLLDEVVAHLVLDGLRLVAFRDQLSQGRRTFGHETPLQEAYG